MKNYFKYFVTFSLIQFPILNGIFLIKSFLQGEPISILLWFLGFVLITSLTLYSFGIGTKNFWLNHFLPFFANTFLMIVVWSVALSKSFTNSIPFMVLLGIGLGFFLAFVLGFIIKSIIDYLDNL